jgi:hypothetical protein
MLLLQQNKSGRLPLRPSAAMIYCGRMQDHETKKIVKETGARYKSIADRKLPFDGGRAAGGVSMVSALEQGLLASVKQLLPIK